MRDTHSSPAPAHDFRSDLPLFVLIDPLLGDIHPVDEITTDMAKSELEAIRSHVWQRPVHGIDLHENLPIDTAYAPYIVELQGPDDPWAIRTLEIAQAECLQAYEGGLAGSGTVPRKIGGWLHSSLIGPTLAHVLSQWMRLDTVTRTPAKYLRLGDSRVLDLLVHAAGKDNFANHMGRVTQWSYFNPIGRWQHLLSAQADLAARPIRLSAAQWTQMSLGSMLHPAVAQAYGQKIMDSGGLELGPNEVEYDAALTVASYWQKKPRKLPHELDVSLIGNEDLVAAAALSLLHPDWVTSSSTVDVLTQAHQDNEQATPLRYCSPDIHARLLEQKQDANAYHRTSSK